MFDSGPTTINIPLPIRASAGCRRLRFCSWSASALKLSGDEAFTFAVPERNAEQKRGYLLLRLYKIVLAITAMKATAIAIDAMKVVSDDSPYLVSEVAVGVLVGS